VYFFHIYRNALFPSVLSVVARGGVVYEFYMEQSSVDFGYIFPRKSKHGIISKIGFTSALKGLFHVKYLEKVRTLSITIRRIKSTAR